MIDAYEFQAKFVAQLKSVLPQNISLAEELSDLLNISTDYGAKVPFRLTRWPLFQKNSASHWMAY